MYTMINISKLRLHKLFSLAAAQVLQPYIRPLRGHFTARAKIVSARGSSQHPFELYTPRVNPKYLTCGLNWFAILLIALATAGPVNLSYCLMNHVLS